MDARGGSYDNLSQKPNTGSAPKLTRRHFLTTLGLAAAAVALKTGRDNSAPAAKVESVQPPPVSVSKPAAEPVHPDPMQEEIKKMIPEERQVFEHVTQSPIFKNYSREDQLKACHLVYAEVQNYKDPGKTYLDRSVNTINWKANLKGYHKRALEIIGELHEQVSPAVNNLLFSSQDFMLPLIFVESEGNQFAINHPETTKDMGLCQLRHSTMQEIADKRKKGTLSDAQMLDPGINVPYGIYYANKLMNIFRDPGVALWAYNLGDGHMRELIKVYVKTEKPEYYEKVVKVLKGDDVDGFTVIPDGSKKDQRAEPAKLVDNPVLNLNFMTMTSSQVVKDWLKDKGIGEENRKYVAKITAGSFIMDASVKEGEIGFTKDGKAYRTDKKAA